MSSSHNIILIVGVLCLLATFSGLLSERFGTPLLLVFIGTGMLAGEDGPGGFVFGDYQSAYLIGSVALTLILFEGGLHTKRGMIREAFWPSAVLATVGVAVSALLVGTAAFLLFRISWIDGLLLGAAIAPTDAAAVSVLLRVSKVVVPKRVLGALEIESGLNDPMSVFLTVVLVQVLTSPGGVSVGHAAMLFAEEMCGGLLIGALGGYLLLWLFRTLRVDRSVSAVLAFGGALAIFGGAQVVGASGFLAVYLAGVVLACHEHTAREPIVQFFGAFERTLAWLNRNRRLAKDVARTLEGAAARLHIASGKPTSRRLAVHV